MAELNPESLSLLENLKNSPRYNNLSLEHQNALNSMIGAGAPAPVPGETTTLASTPTKQPALTPAPSLWDAPGELVSGLGRGMEQAKQVGGGALALAGRTFDAPGLEEAGMDMANRAGQAMEAAPARVQDWRDIDTVAKGADWLAGAVGEAAPLMAGIVGASALGAAGGAVTAPAVGAGLLGAGLRSVGSVALRKILSAGGKTAGQSFSSAVKRKMTEGMLQGAARGAVKAEMGGALVGGLGAGYAAGATAEAGGIYAEGANKPEINKDELAKSAMVGGAVAGLLELLPMGVAAGQMFKAASGKMVAKEIQKGWVREVATTAAKYVGADMLLEGGTEAAQEIVSLAAQAYATPGFDMKDPQALLKLIHDNYDRIVDAAVAGAAVGGAIGSPPAATHVLSTTVQRHGQGMEKRLAEREKAVSGAAEPIFASKAADKKVPAATPAQTVLGQIISPPEPRQPPVGARPTYEEMPPTPAEVAAHEAKFPKAQERVTRAGGKIGEPSLAQGTGMGGQSERPSKVPFTPEESKTYMALKKRLSLMEPGASDVQLKQYAQTELDRIGVKDPKARQKLLDKALWVEKDPDRPMGKVSMKLGKEQWKALSPEERIMFGEARKSLSPLLERRMSGEGLAPHISAAVESAHAPMYAKGASVSDIDKSKTKISNLITEVISRPPSERKPRGKFFKEAGFTEEESKLASHVMDSIKEPTEKNIRASAKEYYEKSGTEMSEEAVHAVIQTFLPVSSAKPDIQGPAPTVPHPTPKGPGPIFPTGAKLLGKVDLRNKESRNILRLANELPGILAKAAEKKDFKEYAAKLSELKNSLIRSGMSEGDVEIKTAPFEPGQLSKKALSEADKKERMLLEREAFGLSAERISKGKASPEGVSRAKEILPQLKSDKYLGTGEQKMQSLKFLGKNIPDVAKGLISETAKAGYEKGMVLAAEKRDVGIKDIEGYLSAKDLSNPAHMALDKMVQDKTIGRKDIDSFISAYKFGAINRGAMVQGPPIDLFRMELVNTGAEEPTSLSTKVFQKPEIIGKLLNKQTDVAGFVSDPSNKPVIEILKDSLGGEKAISEFLSGFMNKSDQIKRASAAFTKGRLLGAAEEQKAISSFNTVFGEKAKAIETRNRLLEDEKIDENGRILDRVGPDGKSIGRHYVSQEELSDVHDAMDHERFLKKVSAGVLSPLEMITDVSSSIVEFFAIAGVLKRSDPGMYKTLFDMTTPRETAKAFLHKKHSSLSDEDSAAAMNEVSRFLSSLGLNAHGIRGGGVRVSGESSMSRHLDPDLAMALIKASQSNRESRLKENYEKSVELSDHEIELLMEFMEYAVDERLGHDVSNLPIPEEIKKLVKAGEFSPRVDETLTNALANYFGSISSAFVKNKETLAAHIKSSALSKDDPGRLALEDVLRAMEASSSFENKRTWNKRIYEHLEEVNFKRSELFEKESLERMFEFNPLAYDKSIAEAIKTPSQRVFASNPNDKFENIKIFIDHTGTHLKRMEDERDMQDMATTVVQSSLPYRVRTGAREVINSSLTREKYVGIPIKDPVIKYNQAIISLFNGKEGTILESKDKKRYWVVSVTVDGAIGEDSEGFQYAGPDRDDIRANERVFDGPIKALWESDAMGAIINPKPVAMVLMPVLPSSGAKDAININELFEDITPEASLKVKDTTVLSKHGDIEDLDGADVSIYNEKSDFIEANKHMAAAATTHGQIKAKRILAKIRNLKPPKPIGMEQASHEAFVTKDLPEGYERDENKIKGPSGNIIISREMTNVGKVAEKVADKKELSSEDVDFLYSMGLDVSEFRKEIKHKDAYRYLWKSKIEDPRGAEQLNIGLAAISISNIAESEGAKGLPAMAEEAAKRIDILAIPSVNRVFLKKLGKEIRGGKVSFTTDDISFIRDSSAIEAAPEGPAIGTGGEPMAGDIYAGGRPEGLRLEEEAALSEEPTPEEGETKDRARAESEYEKWGQGEDPFASKAAEPGRNDANDIVNETFSNAVIERAELTKSLLAGHGVNVKEEDIGPFLKGEVNLNGGRNLTAATLLLNRAMNMGKGTKALTMIHEAAHIIHHFFLTGGERRILSKWVDNRSKEIRDILKSEGVTLTDKEWAVEGPAYAAQLVASGKLKAPKDLRPRPIHKVISFLQKIWNVIRLNGWKSDQDVIDAISGKALERKEPVKGKKLRERNILNRELSLGVPSRKKKVTNVMSNFMDDVITEMVDKINPLKKMDESLYKKMHVFSMANSDFMSTLMGGRLLKLTRQKDGYFGFSEGEDLNVDFNDKGFQDRAIKQWNDDGQGEDVRVLKLKVKRWVTDLDKGTGFVRAIFAEKENSLFNNVSQSDSVNAFVDQLLSSRALPRGKGSVRAPGIYGKIFFDELASVAPPGINPFETMSRKMHSLAKAAQGNEAIKNLYLLDKSKADAVKASGAESLGDELFKLLEMDSGADDVVIFYNENGTKHPVKVLDPDLVKSLMDIETDDSVIGSNRLSRAAKTLYTQFIVLTPAFVAMSFVRDGAFAWVTNTDKNLIPFVNTISGLISAMKDDDYSMMARAAGATGSTVAMHHGEEGMIKFAPRKSYKELGKAVLSSFKSGNVVRFPQDVLNIWYRFAADVETAPRIGVYKQNVKVGKSADYAAFEALNLQNFKMRGASKTMLALTSIVPFLNANLIGKMRTAQTFKDAFDFSTPEKAKNAREVLFKMTLMTAGSIAAWAAIQADDEDKEDYDNLPAYEKIAFWNFYINHKRYQVPKPYETGALLATVPETVLDYFGSGKGGLEMKSATEALVKAQIGSPESIVPTLHKALFEAISGLKADSMLANVPFLPLGSSGGPRKVVPASMKDLPASMQYRPETPLMAQVGSAATLGAASPIGVENLINNLFGKVGAVTMAAFDAILVANGSPRSEGKATRALFGPMFTPGPMKKGSGAEESFYKVVEDMRVLQAQYNELVKENRFEEAGALAAREPVKLQLLKRASKVKKKISKLDAREKAIVYSDMTIDEKRKAIKELDVARKSIFSDYMQAHRSALANN